VHLEEGGAAPLATGVETDQPDCWRQGKPKELSWCSWFQRICRNIGPHFDGSGIVSGEQALNTWKAMQEKAREEWKESYRAFCGLKEEVLPRGRPSSCLDTRQPAAAVPSTRTLSMADFEKRWSCLKDPNKSVQMSRDKAGFPTKKFFSL
jgi:hypothetical protein